jgi:hypothetical protein
MLATTETSSPLTEERETNALAPTHESNLLHEQLSQAKGLQSTEIEMKHVYEVYDEIAVHWHHTRGKRKVPLPLPSSLTAP